MSRNLRNILAMLLLPLAFFSNITAFADDISCVTNRNGLALFLTIPQTNIICGDKISITVIVSNMTSIERRLDWATGNPCSTGFGEFRIVETGSGKLLDCQLPLEDRVNFLSHSLDYLGSHEVKRFEKNLAYGYAVTNVGIYSIQFAGSFRSLKTPDIFFDLTTPPIEISISSKTTDTSSSAPPH